jgi:hypothetical protein
MMMLNRYTVLQNLFKKDFLIQKYELNKFSIISTLLNGFCGTLKRQHISDTAPEQPENAKGLRQGDLQGTQSGGVFVTKVEAVPPRCHPL